MFCRECGARNPENVSFCNGCGRPAGGNSFQNNHSQHLSGSVGAITRGQVCPSCGSPDIKSVPMLFEQGTIRSSSVSVYVGTHRNFGIIPTVGSSSTLAAQRLAPPTKKDAFGTGVVFGAIFGGIGGAFICRLLDLNYGGNVAVMWVLGGAAIGWILSRIKNQEYESEWESAFETWRSSFQCQRCGVVFSTAANVCRGFEDIVDLNDSIVKQQFPR